MISKKPSAQPIVKEQSALSSLDRGPAPAGGGRNAYNRRREQVRKAQRNHRDRKKMYVKSMEDEILRLQDEWAAVLEEIAHATEENIILKDILKCQPFRLSSPTKTQRVISSHATSFSNPMQERSQCVETAFVVPHGHLRNSINNFQLSTLESMATSSPSSDSTGSITMYRPKFEDSESPGSFPTTSTLHKNCQSLEDSHSFSVFMTPSPSHQTRGKCLQPQPGRAKGMKRSVFSVSSTMSCSHLKILGVEHNVNFGLCPARSDSVHSLEQVYPSLGQGGHCGAEPRSQHGISGATSSGDALNRTLSSISLHSSDADLDQFFLLRAHPAFAVRGPAAAGQSSTLLYDSDSPIDQSFPLEADPTSAGYSYATTNLLNHQPEVTDWWPETV